MKNETAKLLEKAVRSLKTARSLFDSEDTEFVASRAYYAMFYIAEALLHERDLTFHKHSGVHSAFGKYFVKTGEWDQKYHQWLIQAFNKRLLCDYSFEATINRDHACEMIHQADEFLREARAYLSK